VAAEEAVDLRSVHLGIRFERGGDAIYRRSRSHPLDVFSGDALQVGHALISGERREALDRFEVGLAGLSTDTLGVEMVAKIADRFRVLRPDSARLRPKCRRKS
jgi:hypothetical protein